MNETQTANSNSRSRRRRSQRPTAGSELRQLIRAIQELTLELAQLRHAEDSGPEFEAKEHTLEQLRWRLAALARKLATDDFGAAA
jgi:hypothetical protein